MEVAEDPVLRTMLFDFYGELLTDKQREYFDLHYNEDLSLAARREALADIENRLSALLDSPDAAARRISREVIDALRGLDD